MSNLVCVSGDFCSGSTLVFTLFRMTRLYHCLYEPLHEYMREFLVYGLRAEESSHHFFVEQYYREFKGFKQAGALFNPRWGAYDLYLAPDTPADDLYRYFSYIIGMSFGRSPRVMFKENRMTFRLGWFRARFPHARVVHIYRDPESQWRSIVRRVQAHHGREDVGQQSVHFTGFNMARWCEDLKNRFPELEASRSSSGFERFSKLWQRSYDENVKYADVSIDYRDLLRDFDATATRMFAAVGQPDVDVAALRKFVVSDAHRDRPGPFRAALKRAEAGLDRMLRAYARAHVRVQTAIRERRHAVTRG